MTPCSSQTPALAAIRTRLADSTDALARSTEALLEQLKADPSVADAGAVPYLELMGTVLGGYLLARGAAAGRKEAADGEDRFLTEKRTIAAFFAEYFLPRAAALEQAATAGAAALSALDDEDF